MFKNMTIGRKIGLGFAVVLLFLAAVAVITYTQVSSVVSGVQVAIARNALDENITQSELDHLNWANQVSALLTDASITQLDVQTDDHKCRFGKWLYGEPRKEAEKVVPAIAPMLKEIEAYHSNLHASAITIGEHFRQADASLPGLLASREVDHLAWAHKVKDAFLNNLDTVAVQTDPAKCAFGKWLGGEESQAAVAADPEFGKRLDACRGPHGKLHESVIAIQNTWARRHEGLIDVLKDRLDDHRRWANTLCQAVALEDANFDLQTDPHKCAFGKFLESDQCQQWSAEFPEFKTAIEACRAPHKKLHESATHIREALAQAPAPATSAPATETASSVAQARQIYADVTAPALEEIGNHFGAAIAAEQALVARQTEAAKIFNEQTVPALAHVREALHGCREYTETALVGMTHANHVFASETKPNLNHIQTLLGQVRDKVQAAVEQENKAAVATAQGTRRNVSIVSGIAIVIGIVMALLIASGIIRTLTRIIVSLREGAEQVNAAAGQVSSAGQTLAAGATEQASSLEETSSALEEMAAMTRTNAENSKEANSLSDQARGAAEQGDSTMGKLSQAMEAINESSGQISKIIKVIEEIAFQTNLLALNAAVEAARAGEHGKGFAVVADEVRNLAQRSAEAARETTALIEESVSRAGEGTQVAREVAEALGAIVQDVTKVSDLIQGISTATQEQAQGVDQLNTAVSQMDKVTQQNASGAEESASAAEELAAQSQAVNATVNDLVTMVGGAAQRAGNKTTAAGHWGHHDNKPLGASPPKRRLGGKKSKAAVTASAPVASEDEFAGLDDSGLENF